MNVVFGVYTHEQTESFVRFGIRKVTFNKRNRILFVSDGDDY